VAQHFYCKFGNYQTFEFLGEGHFASVYRAKNSRTGEEVAIKVLHSSMYNKEEFARFAHEAELMMSRLRHKHIIHAREFKNEQGKPYIVMDYAPYGNLQRYYLEGIRLPLRIVQSYVEQITAGLGYAHAHNIVHCDLKPENILVGVGQILQLSDFNLSLDLPNGESAFLSTQQVAGTVYYIAPEQIDGHPCRASDQYALGIMIYQWLSGELPFQGETAEAILDQHVNAPPPSLRAKFPTFPLALENVIRKALEKDPSRRYPSIEAFASAFNQAIIRTQASSQRFGDYQTTEFLGKGRFASVYRAKDSHTEEEVAIKVLHFRTRNERELTRFSDEAELTISKLKHKHITHVKAFNTKQGRPYIVMDYAPYGNLQQRHPQGTRLSLTTVQSYIQQITAGLGHAHTQNIVHCNLKPENILVGAGEILQLSDFNLFLDLPHGESVFLSIQQVAGTVSYIAPEQIDGHPCSASDQYALAVMIYQWLSGEPPFQGESAEAILDQHINTPPPSLRAKLPELPLTVENVIRKALEKHPLRRYHSIEAFASAFNRAATSLYHLPLISMPYLHKSKKAIEFKIVYYGINQSGKCDNVKYIYNMIKPQEVSRLVSIDTEGERTLYFHFSSADFGKIYGYQPHLHLYTVPAQKQYPQTRSVVLRNVSCIIFVADSQASKLRENVESWNELLEYLRRMGKEPTSFPLVIQWNKRDSKEDILPVSVLEQYLNPYHVPSFEAKAETGEGILECLRAGISIMWKNLELL
jgi:serine/threonine protein kinase